MNKTLRTLFFLLIFIAAFVSACRNGKSDDQQPSEKDEIVKAFTEWSVSAVRSDVFSSADSCNPSYFKSHPKNTKLDEGLGLPDSAKFHFLFADINNDQHLDALVTFHPVCCTCSDTTGKVIPQIQVLIVSGEKGGYTATNSFFNNLFADSLNINIDIDSVSTNNFYGTYFKIGKQDTSVDQYQKSISIAYDTKEMKFIKRNTGKKAE